MEDKKEVINLSEIDEEMKSFCKRLQNFVYDDHDYYLLTKLLMVLRIYD